MKTRLKNPGEDTTENPGEYGLQIIALPDGTVAPNDLIYPKPEYRFRPFEQLSDFSIEHSTPESPPLHLQIVCKQIGFFKDVVDISTPRPTKEQKKLDQNKNKRLKLNQAESGSESESKTPKPRPKSRNGVWLMLPRENLGPSKWWTNYMVRDGHSCRATKYPVYHGMRRCWP